MADVEGRFADAASSGLSRQAGRQAHTGGPSDYEAIGVTPSLVSRSYRSLIQTAQCLDYGGVLLCHVAAYYCTLQSLVPRRSSNIYICDLFGEPAQEAHRAFMPGRVVSAQLYLSLQACGPSHVGQDTSLMCESDSLRRKRQSWRGD